MEKIFKEEELKKYIDDYYALYFGNGGIGYMTPKEVFEMGFRTGIAKVLYDTGDER